MKNILIFCLTFHFSSIALSLEINNGTLKEFVENAGKWNVTSNNINSVGSIFDILVVKNNCEFLQTLKTQNQYIEETGAWGGDYYLFFCPSFPKESKLIECRNDYTWLDKNRLPEEMQNWDLDFVPLKPSMVLFPQTHCRTR